MPNIKIYENFASFCIHIVTITHLCRNCQTGENRPDIQP